MEVTKWPYCVSVRCTPTVRPHTLSEVGLCCRDHVARQQYPLLAQWGDGAHIFKESKPFPVLLFRREASLMRLLYNPATEGVLEEQIRFARKQLMARTCNRWHTYSFISVQAQVSTQHSSAKNTLEFLFVKNLPKQFTIEKHCWIKLWSLLRLFKTDIISMRISREVYSYSNAFYSLPLIKDGGQF